jgi:hypothetical protein
MSKRISFSLKDAELLYDIVHHCVEHNRWMAEVFENGKNIYTLEDRLIEFVNKENRKDDKQ